MTDWWLEADTNELVQAVALCPSVSPSGETQRAESWGLAFYLVRLADHDHVELRTYGDAGADFESAFPPPYTLSTVHGVVLSLVAAFRDEEVSRPRPLIWPVVPQTESDAPEGDDDPDPTPDPDGNYPEGTIVAGEWAGVFCIEDYRVFQEHIGYIEAVHAATTYGEARAAGAEVDDRRYLDYYADTYLEAHPDEDENIWQLDDDECWQVVCPPDDAPFKLDRHPMWSEGDWGPRPSNFGYWTDEHFKTFIYGDNGGRVSSIEGFHPEEGEEIVRHLRSQGWTVLTGYRMHHYWG